MFSGQIDVKTKLGVGSTFSVELSVIPAPMTEVDAP
jgi:hypothetical protein